MNDMPQAPASEFDVDAWGEKLLALNPWVRGLQDEGAFNTARQKATLERYTQGRETWNAWANAMLASKQALETAGRWAVTSRLGWGHEIVGENDETRHWLALSTAVFRAPGSKHAFEGDADFRGFIFPGDTMFDFATFSGIADFSDATFSGRAVFDRTSFSDKARFDTATFSADAWFSNATFSGYATFNRAAFSKGAWFLTTTFSHEVSFWETAFSGTSAFSEATFTGSANFNGATFSHVAFDKAIFVRGAVFGETTFDQGANLKGAQFKGPTHFTLAKFRGSVDLRGSTFLQLAEFEAIDSQGTFSLADATFRQVPSFLGAQVRTLRLDNVKTPRYPLLGWTSDKDAPALFRELKRRAAEAQDHDRELEFFTQEIRTSRFHAKGLPAFVPRVWEWRFWFGLLFGTFSDFGRSLWRPVLFWLALVVASAVFYLGEHEEMKKARAAFGSDSVSGTVMAYVATTRAALANPPACRPQGRELFAATDAVTEAIQLSLRNAVVFEGGRADSTRRTLGCLYGLETAGDQEYPKVSPRVSAASIVQGLASVILIFLFLLAVRNLLRLK